VPPKAQGPPPPDGGGKRGGVRLALLAPSGEANMAALEGTLHAEGRCLYIAGNDTAKSRTFPAFSIAGLRWDSVTKTLHMGAASFRQGQRVVLTGGEPANRAALDWVQSPDPSCDTSDLFVAGGIAAAGEQATN
jgi:hypothetical protein